LTAPVVAWVAFYWERGWLGLINWQAHLKTPSQTILEPTGSGQFSLAAMVGNTGYLGYPITLAFAGSIL